MQIGLDLGYNYKIIQSQHYHPDSWSWIVRIFESPHSRKYEYYWTEYRSYKSLCIIVCICQKYFQKVITCIKLNNKVLKPEMMTYTVDQFVSSSYSVPTTCFIILWNCISFRIMSTSFCLFSHVIHLLKHSTVFKNASCANVLVCFVWWKKWYGSWKLF